MVQNCKLSYISCSVLMLHQLLFSISTRSNRLAFKVEVRQSKSRAPIPQLYVCRTGSEVQFLQLSFCSPATRNTFFLHAHPKPLDARSSPQVRASPTDVHALHQAFGQEGLTLPAALSYLKQKYPSQERPTPTAPTNLMNATA